MNLQYLAPGPDSETYEDAVADVEINLPDRARIAVAPALGHLTAAEVLHTDASPEVFLALLRSAAVQGIVPGDWPAPLLPAPTLTDRDAAGARRLLRTALGDDDAPAYGVERGPRATSAAAGHVGSAAALRAKDMPPTASDGTGAVRLAIETRALRVELARAIRS